MSKRARRTTAATEQSESADLPKKRYDKLLYKLWIELVKFQKHAIEHNIRTLVIIEGRDAAGKDGVIKRIIAHLSPRETRVVALRKPSDRERSYWHFQRWVRHLPAADELVLFNRSWYNRAGVELVMGYCTEKETEEFLQHVGPFERLLVESDIQLFKYYLDISKDEQKKRMEERRRDPLSQWKISPVDAAAVAHWADYSRARDAMLARSHTRHAPWTVVRADLKKRARIAIIRDLLSRCEYKGKDSKLLRQDGDTLRRYDRRLATSGRLCYP